MAVPLDALQVMMAELQKMNHQNMTELVKQQFEALAVLVQQNNNRSGGGVMTDTRGIGRPINFKGEEGKYAEWKAKLLAYLRVTAPSSDAWIAWSAGCTSPIIEEDVDLAFPNHKAAIMEFSAKLYAILLSCTEDDAFRICHSVKEGNGLEAMRLLMKRYEPRTPGTKREPC